MQSYLIIRLAGPMQAWGQPTFEGHRPSAAFPTRSGLLGLLGACLGIRREDKAALQALADSVRFAVCCDERELANKPLSVSKLTDYHTIQNAREDYRGLKSHETIQTWREYLCDAQFTVALWCTPDASLTIEKLTSAVKKPVFTPYLGRRSCPLAHPLFLGENEAEDPRQALAKFEAQGVIYSEEMLAADNRRVRVRDEPIIALPRQFASRDWFIIQGGGACT
ncbi:type I-E CRISPR-associated protein Cas5/CasD [Pokkaliibacter plantistimulans]|uniref:Type I-E CRISPR-associated protein Cas5/CasD n=1 Tax=Proteobacteria bacterium 228 TaxID=2083153 RepID=A0A2S5KJT0_9PROT|nr:type I-E CRISPR-associated protein Cas5/CasD [Pokkaliibacter plantistimulans]PPC75071.1 type I-E CRISPR-associated protein Cas5/CasD [Pokkaliibacter plantistimulans]